MTVWRNNRFNFRSLSVLITNRVLGRTKNKCITLELCKLFNDIKSLNYKSLLRRINIRATRAQVFTLFTRCLSCQILCNRLYLNATKDVVVCGDLRGLYECFAPIKLLTCSEFYVNL